jgi:hypothetical protein
LRVNSNKPQTIVFGVVGEVLRVEGCQG